MSERPRGFGYLGLLFFVAITAAALAALGSSWSTAAQRERERELEFRGGEIARAIASYVKASTDGIARHPRTLEDLLEDERGPKPVHHLRRLYLDPFTGQADWVLIPATSGAGERGFSASGFVGVHSRSEQILLRQLAEQGDAVPAAKDWLFLGRPAAAAGEQDASSMPPGADNSGNQPTPEPGPPRAPPRPPNQPIQKD